MHIYACTYILVLTGQTPYDGAIDVWAIGLVHRFMLTGARMCLCSVFSVNHWFHL